MKKRVISFLCYLSAFCLLLSACGDKPPAAKTSSVPIAITEQIPHAIVGEAYDLSLLITEEDGVTYEFTAGYTDPGSGEYKQLNVRRGKITPKVEADITVHITATKGPDSASAELVVPIQISADTMDMRLSEQTLEGTTATVTKENIHEGNSCSAVEITFNGTSAIMDLTDHRLQPYYSAQVWHNAAVSFWVYTPANQDVTFQLVSHKSESPKVQAAAGQWTQVVFSLYDMGITEPMYDSPLYATEGSLQVVASSAGNDACTISIDQLDIVHADTIEGLSTGYSKPSVPSGNYSDLLASCKVYTEDPVARLEKLSASSYRFGSNQATGYPTYFIDFAQTTDISGFDYLKFDVLAENAYPHLTVSVHYLDDEGSVKHKGTSYDYYANQWQTIYVNLDYLHGVDLTKAVGISIAVHMDTNFVTGQFNSISFRNMSLYVYPGDEPQLPPAIIEDNDLISGSFYTTSTKPNTNGVCKVSADETGTSKSNSMLLFWTNNACGYPVVDATFMFDNPQDWTDKSVLSFDTHQDHGHYWLQLTILYLDENGKEKSAVWYFDTLITTWKTNHASFEWFKAEDGSTLKPEMLDRVVGIRVAPNMAINVTAEVAQIYFDNFVLS